VRAARWLLSLARAASDAARAELAERDAAELEVTAKAERKRVQREQEERAKRAARRAFTQTLDLGLSVCGLWFRDLAVVRAGAPELVHASDMRAELETEAARWPGAPPLYEAVALVDDTRARLLVNVNEELALEALGYRLAAIAPSSGSNP
jgi:DNA polymerase-3 subunit delta'